MNIVEWFRAIITGKKDDKNPVPGIFAPSFDVGPWGLTPTDPSEKQFRLLVAADKGLVSICIDKNAEAVASQNLRLYVNKPTNIKKMLFPTRSLSKQEKNYFIENMQSVLKRKTCDILPLGSN